MSEFTAGILIAIVAILFISASLTLTKPVSGGGRLARKLCLANAFAWLVLLLLPNTGHPPAFLIPGLVFWLINLALLPAAGGALWTGRKDGAERSPFFAVACTYIILNAVILYVVPFVSVLWGAFFA